tara:strand:- start:2071 stop:2226 length:156 start_codon:yes stop_codon:yes gene_type:complete
MLNSEDLKVILDLLDNHYLDNKRLTLSRFQTVLELQKKLQTMINEMEKSNG